MNKPNSPRPPRQLDIFADSRDVMLRNELIDALVRRDLPTCCLAIDLLGVDYPADALLTPARVLQQALADAQGRADAPTASAPEPLVSLQAASLHLQKSVAPAAAAVLGEAGGRAWMAPLWRGLAQRHAQLAWHADQPDGHAAPLWLRAGAWPQAQQSVNGIASWRRIPAPLAWMCEARYRQQGIDAVWPLLAELAWLAPRRFDLVLRHLADPLLNRLRRSFESDFDLGLSQADDPLALAWFPAWVLIDKPALAAQLALAEPGLDSRAERGMRLMLQLLHLERQGRHHDLLARRKAMRDLCAPLYAAYMATR